MKRTLGTVICLLALAFPITGLAQIPNPGFEAWTGTTNLVPTGWLPNNIPGIITPITRSTTAHSGTYSLQGSVGVFSGLATYPAILWSGFKFSDRPASLTGYYQFTSVAHDSVVMLLWLYNSSLTSYVAVGTTSLTGTTNQWTKFTAPLTWAGSNAPDTAWIEIATAPGDNDTLHLGTTFLLDDLAFEGTATSVAEQQLKPTVYALHQNYPNPFNPSTKIQYELPVSSVVRLSVYNLLGQEVAVLVNDLQPPGSHEVQFDASKMSSGTYFYRLQAGDFLEVKKMTLVR